MIAYTSLIWWASAGDSRSGLIEAEELAGEQDEALLRESCNHEGSSREVAMVAYFHKLSALIFSVLTNAVRRSGTNEQERYRDQENGTTDENDEQQQLLSAPNEEDVDMVEVTEDDVRAMGLDIWSESDKKFISQMMWQWWQRKAVVRAGNIECCGMRLL